MRRLAILFLVAQGVGVAVWWLAMLMFPAARGPFMAPGAPDSTLLAFVLPDLALYSGASLLAAYGLGRNTAWAWPALCLHSGAAIYTALYGLALPFSAAADGWERR